MQNLVTQIKPSVKIRRTRLLPVSGTVLVRIGQKVTPPEVLAECQIPTRHIIIDVVRTLGLKGPSEAEKLIDRSIGDLLEKGDIIAETGGLFSRVLRAPLSGKIIAIRNGQVMLEVESRKVVVQSGFTGEVVDILDDRGAVIETNGTLIQGVWGNGMIGYGPFVSDMIGVSQELNSATMSITARGAIIAASWCESEESLQAGASLPIGGLILGSMSPHLIPCALQQPYPIILLEGFGKIGINEPAKKVLLDSAQRDMSLNAVKWDHFTGLRPEISITLPVEGSLETRTADLAQGQQVRIHSAPYAGKVGVITTINSSKTVLPNGLRTSTALITFSETEKAVVPLSNFDIIDI
jgi:hypothetical protein